MDGLRENGGMNDESEAVRAGRLRQIIDYLEAGVASHLDYVDAPESARVHFENGREFSLAEVRDAALAFPQIIETLNSNGVDLGWLELPENSPERRDRAPDWQEYAHRFHVRSRSAAKTANWLATSLSDDSLGDFETGLKDRALIVTRVLGACSRCLRRFANRGELVLFRSADPTGDLNVDGPDGRSVRDIFLTDPLTVMAPNQPFVRRLIEFVIDRLIDGQSIVPGFDAIECSADAVKLKRDGKLRRR